MDNSNTHLIIVSHLFLFREEYRSVKNLNFTIEMLQKAQNEVRNFYNFLPNQVKRHA